VEYRYTVDHVKESEYKGYEILQEAESPASRTENNRHGIRLIFRQVGEVGIFDMQTLLVNAVVAVGLLGGATALVDVLMVYVLPQKVRYK